MPSFKTCHFSQSSFPCLHIFYVVLEMFFMFSKGLGKSLCLFMYTRWIHIRKNRQNYHFHLFHASNDLYKFIQAPCRRCIVSWENDNRKSWFFYCFQECWCNRFPCLKFSSSLKTSMPFCFKATYIWSVKLLRVSSPLKLRKTSYFQFGVDEDEAFWVLMEAIRNTLTNLELQ